MTHFRFLRPLMSAALVLMCATAFAVPAKRVSKTVTLTDGTQVTVTLRGDENLHYYSTADGRIVEQKADGTYDFVSADRMNTRRAKAAQRRESMEKARRVKHKVGNSGNYIGQKKGLVILVNFKDVKLQSGTATTFPRMANEVGYKGNGHYGSVHDYFLAQSYGQFDLTFDVVGPVTVSQNMAYYGAPADGDHDSYPAKMVIEAINLVDDSAINFADYDWDNDGYVDQVYVIYAGYGQASGASEDTIWPHEWDLESANYYGDGTGKLQKDGKWINTYACSNELDGKSGTKLDGIGTMCHEFSHCLGLPDFYDTEGNNFGMDSWSIMDYGCYNSDGCIPCGYTAYERMFAGWLTPTELDESATITGMPDINDQSTSGAPKAYIIYNDANSNEFYTLQNIQQTGWNQGAYGHGLLVSHIDFNQTAWTQNKVNTSSSHQRGTIIHADNEAGTSASSLAGDTFPGTSKNTSLTNTTTPAATLYNNNSKGTKFLNGPLTEITETGGLISFLFDGGEQAPSPELAWSKTYLSVDIDASGTPSFPTLTNTHGVSVTYESSNTAVATISTSGVVALTGTSGTTIISAIFAGNDDYKAETVTYTLVVYSSSAGDQPAGTLWEEDFGTNYSTNKTTYQYNVTNCTVRSENYASGTSPELMISAGKSFSAVIPMNGHFGDMTLTFKSNRNSSKLTVTATGASLSSASGSNPYTYTVTVPAGTENVTLNFTAGSDNARFDDARLYQGEDPTPELLDPELAWSAAASSARVGASDNVYPTLSNPHNVSVTYTSSNTSAATIATNGTITPVAAGVTTISAIFAGNSTYEAQTVTYQLTVLAAEDGDDDEVVKLWEEDFHTYSANNVPTGGTYSYACVDGGSDTKIYNETLAGGTSPELLIGKSGGSFTAVIPMNGHSGTLTLSFLSNKSVNVSATNATLGAVEKSGSSYTYPVTVASGTTSITLTFAMSTSSNARVDNFLLTCPASSTPEPQPAGLEWSNTTCTATIDGENSFPTLTNPHSLTVSYASSNTAAATINASTGAITLVAAGTTTISAIFAGNDDYLQQTVEYTLTVQNASSGDDDEPATLWSEDFSEYAAEEKPTGGTYSYACTGSGTKIYSESSAGGTAPELLINGKNNGTFSATIPMNGHSGEMTLTFNANKNITVEAIGASLTQTSTSNPYTYTVSVATGTTSITLTFSNDGANCRVDNFLLTCPGGSTDDREAAGLAWSTTAYTATIGGENLFPTLTNPHSVAVSYESSNTAAATIDATTGAITLVAPGTTTISASFDGSASYEAQTVTYTLTVEGAQGGDDDDDEPVTLWSEDFSSYAKDAVPDGGTYGYACVDGGSPTKIWAENTAGGTSPELLIGKSTGSFSATIPMNGHSGTLTLSFVSNKNVSVTVEGATLGTKVNDGKSYTYPVTVAPGTQSITLTFATTTSDNARVDNFLLVSSNGGSSDPVPAGLEWSATAYTATIGATNTFPTLTNPYGVTVSYTSSNTDAATIDATTGAITLVAPGTTTISASFDGNASYEAQTVTYTLTVEEAQGGDDDDEPVTLWSEDFGTNFEANTTTYQYDLTNTTIQTQDKTGTNILAGGESPELLIKANKTFSAVIPMNGHYGNMTLTFKSNRNVVTTTADGATLGDATITGAGPYIYTIPVSVSAGTQNVTLYFKAGSSNARFDDARLYKGEDTPTLQDPELTWSTAAYTATIGATNTFPTLTNPYGVTVSYESSNTAAATIDASTGAITLVAPGTTTISASFDGNASYEAQTVTYTLTVEEAQGGDDDDEPVTLWSEDFSSYAKDAVPDGGTYGYACTGSGTKIYNETTAGGTSPELLINGKNNGTFSATIPMNGHSGELTLTFLSNKNIHVDATGATLTQKTTTSPYTYTVNVPTGTESVEFTFSNDGANCRVDNFLLTAPGNVGPQPQSAGLEWSKTSYTATIGGENLFPTLTNPHGVTVSYSSSTPAVATIDATTGAITLVAPGTTTISAIFDGNDDYQAQTVTYNLAVSIANDITSPYTIAEAYDLIDADYDLDTWVYVKGVISNITEVDVTGTYGNATYDISDNTTTAELHIFRGYGLDNVKFNKGAELIQIGDEVIVYGQLYYYENDDRYEMKQGNYIVSHTHPAKTLDFADGTTYSEASAQTYDELTYTRTFGNTSWQALYLPFSLSYDDWKDELDIADIYNIIQYDDDNNGSFDRTYLVILHKTSGQTLPNRPYLVRAKTAGTFTCTLNDVELQPAEDKTIDCSSTFYTYSFTGNYAPREGSVMIANGDYALGGGELHKAASDAVLKAQRWYMHITPREGAPTLLPRAIGIIEHGEETEGIALTTDNRQQTTAGFDITGRAVNAANGKQRGITIVNGKKVIR